MLLLCFEKVSPIELSNIFLNHARKTPFLYTTACEHWAEAGLSHSSSTVEPNVAMKIWQRPGFACGQWHTFPLIEKADYWRRNDGKTL